MPPSSKKLKVADGRALATSTHDSKGKGKALVPSSALVSPPSDDDSGSDEENLNDDSEESGDDSGGSIDTDEEIENAQLQASKSKQTLKRKRRAIPQSSFGQALTSLLDTSPAAGKTKNAKPSEPVPSSSSSTLPSRSERPASWLQSQPAADTALLALKKTSYARQKLKDEKSKAKAAKAELGERKEREERNRVTDVIGGWGGESERALRKVAQRGVVKLFNIIQQAQQSSTQATTEATKVRGTGKASLPAPSADAFRDDGGKKGKGKGQKDKDNALGRAKPIALGQDDFLQSIRAGGLVSKT